MPEQVRKETAGSQALREIVVLSGKGGTGKTSLCAAWAGLAKRAVVADCDVDAADLALVMTPRPREAHDFYSGVVAAIDPAVCQGCGHCQQQCRFAAISAAADGIRTVTTQACEGCGVCALVCPAAAVALHPRLVGRWMVGDTQVGPLVHARLTPGGENSGRLVTVVRNRARELAVEQGYALRLIDGPPGLGCPVIASCTGADAVVLVTEPSRSGHHDLIRIMALARRLELRCHVIVNRWDLAPELSEAICREALDLGAHVLGTIRYDRGVVAAQLAATNVCAFDTPASDDIRATWSALVHKESLHVM